MKEDCDEFLSRDEKRKLKLQDATKGNTLLSEVIEQDEEIELYKSRLKELETAFYYNLELISERDLELTVLEKQLVTENEKLQEVVRERHELEDLVKIIDEKSNRKIQQLETRLSFKEGEVKDLQRENAANINTLKRLVADIKQQQERKIYKLSTKFEREKNELMKRYQEETEEKEKYYLLEIDHLAGKLEQVCREKDELAAAEEENKSLKCQLQDAERYFLEKENYYLEKIRKLNNPWKGKLNREVQCNFKPEGMERVTQARPDVASTDSQTLYQFPDLEEQYLRKIKFLQEQNEVLKCVVKDLKKNRKAEPRDLGQPPGCECSATRTEIEQVNKKFENEINNLKKILQEELEKRTEEDAVIESLEATVTCLKDKLLLRLQENFKEPEGQDMCTYTYNRELQNEIQVKLLEQKLNKMIGSVLAANDGAKERVLEHPGKPPKECLEKTEEFSILHHRPTDFQSEDLEKIRLEMQKLENKIESDSKLMAGSNSASKCEQIFRRRLETPDQVEILHDGPVFPKVGFAASGRLSDRKEFADMVPTNGPKGKGLPRCASMEGRTLKKAASHFATRT